MSYARAAWAWLGSVVTCACLLVAWVAPWVLSHAQNDLVDVATVATISMVGWMVGMFAMAAALVYVPTFSVLEYLSLRPLTRVRAVLLGSALALVPRLLMGWRFDESDSPRAWLVYWASHLRQ